jgi:hypothetical protein
MMTMTPLDKILQHDPGTRRPSRLEEYRAERNRLIDGLDKLDAGTRTFDAVGDQMLSKNDTTESTRARWAARVVDLDKRITSLVTSV